MATASSSRARPDNLVEGNIIGTDATGTKALGNGAGGVEIDGTLGPGATDNTIGGATAIAGNLITDNDAAGVIVTDDGGIGNDSVVGNQITANRIFGNTGQAIDLDDDGVTENSATPRLGANMLQNFPIIVTTASGQLEGWLGYGVPDASYRIDLFASAHYGPGGSGEAEDFLGSLEVTTNSAGRCRLQRPLHAASRPAHRHRHGHRSGGQYLRSLSASGRRACSHRLRLFSLSPTRLTR